MTLRQTVQAAPGKTSDLIAKLSETSNQAVKTREGLFAQLGDELTRYVEIEEQHFLPLLRKHDDTKALVPDALKGNKDLRASLEKLTAMPKDTDAFLAELDVLNKSFQQHIRNERKELLPAVLKALSNEEASDLAASLDGAVADAEKAKRDEKREEAAKAKRDEEKAEADAKAKRDAAKAEREAEKAKEAAEEKRKAAKAERDEEQAEADAKAKRDAAKAERDAEKAKKVAAEKREAAKAKRESDKVEQIKATKRAAAQAQKTAEQTQQVAADTQEAMASGNQTTRTVREGLQAVVASSSASAGAATDIYAVWMEYVSSAARINITASQQLMQCKSIREVAELQTEFATSALRNMMEGNAKVLEIARNTSKQATSPLDARPD